MTDALLLAAAGVVAALLLLVLLRGPRAPSTDGRLEAIGTRVETIGAAVQVLQTRMEPLTAAPGTLAKLDERTQTVAKTAIDVAAVRGELARLPGIDARLHELWGVFRSAGGRGAKGEEAVEAVLKQFPDDVWAPQHALKCGVVDFVVKMPNGLLLPIDSKTSGLDGVAAYLEALRLVDEATAAGDAEAVVAAETALDKARRAVSSKVSGQADRITKYIEPGSGTTAFVVQAVPDAVFEAVDAGARLDAADRGVLLVPYTLLAPYVSLVRRMHQRGELDLQRLEGSIARVHTSCKRIEEALKNSVERAATMATNGATAVRAEVVAIVDALGTLESGAGKA